MIVHDIKHPTEALIKILDHLQSALNPDEIANVIEMVSDLEENAEK